MFHGAIVATITPFRNGKVDATALKKLVEFQIRNGTDGVVPCGTTGESATLAYEEHERVIDLVLEAAAGRVPVIAGTGSNNTKEAVLLTRYAAKVGANAALVIHFDPKRVDFGEVFLEGDTSWSCDGKIFEEAYRY